MWKIFFQIHLLSLHTSHFYFTAEWKWYFMMITLWLKIRNLRFSHNILILDIICFNSSYRWLWKPREPRFFPVGWIGYLLNIILKYSALTTSYIPGITLLSQTTIRSFHYLWQGPLCVKVFFPPKYHGIYQRLVMILTTSITHIFTHTFSSSIVFAVNVLHSDIALNILIFAILNSSIRNVQ